MHKLIAKTTLDKHALKDKQGRIRTDSLGRPLRRRSDGTNASPWDNPRIVNKARTLYVDMGLSMRTVARNLGVSHSTVQRLVEKMGWVRTKHATATKWLRTIERNADKIEDWYLKGTTVPDMMRRLKIRNTNKFMTWLGTQPYYDRWERNRVAQRRGTARRINDKLATDITKLDGSEYSELARSLTWNVWVIWKHVLPNSEKRGTFTMHLDHRFSIFDAVFLWSNKEQRLKRRRKPLPLRFLCHPANLQMITAIDNAYKGASSSITFSKLKVDIKAFEAVHGKVFL